MTWVAWRQLRLPLLSVFTVLGLLAVALLLTGPGILNAFHADARGFLHQLNGQQFGPLLYVVGVVLLYALPPVLGAFWGAPLVARELETGTYKLAWTQSITRSRWLAGRLGLVAGTAIGLTGILSLLITWWSAPVDDAVAAGEEAGPFLLPRMHPLIFGARGLVPVGYAAVGVVLGVTLGVLLRRTVAALALTFALMVAVQLAVPVLIRPHLMAADRELLPLSERSIVGVMLSGHGSSERAHLSVTTPDPGAWVTSNDTVDASGRVPDAMPSWATGCGPPVHGGGGAEASDFRACVDRLTAEGYRQQVVQLPAGDFWTLQWRETTLLFGLATLLLLVNVRQIRRDPS